MKYPVLFLICFFTHALCGNFHAFAASSSKISTPRLIDQVESLARQEKWDEAKEKLDVYLKNHSIDEKYLPEIHDLWRQIALARAKQAARKKDWAQAEEELKIVLALDPDNAKVARRLKEIAQLRRQLETFRAKVNNQAAQTEVREEWSKAPINVCTDGTNPPPSKLKHLQSEIIPMSRKNDFMIRQKLKTICLPQVDFENATIEDVAIFLTTRSRELDSEKIGVAFLAQDDARRQAKKISLSLHDAPLGEVLKYVAQLAELKYRVDEQAVFFEPLKTNSFILVSRDFAVRQQFVTPSMELKFYDDENPSGVTQNTKVISENLDAETVKKVLEMRGVVFQNPPEEILLPDGTSRSPRADEYPTAMYSPSTGILTARNTQEQIDYLEKLILCDMADQGANKIIKIETRVLEINQNDLDELGVDWSFNGGTLPANAFPLPGSQSGTHVGLSGVAASTNFEGANDLPHSNLDNLIGKNQDISENTLTVKGLLDGVTFQAVLTALSQKKSANMISAPTILVNSGSSGAVIEVVKEFIYPTAFDPPQVKLYRKDRYGGDEAILDRVVIPSWPSDFKTPGRKIGVSIRVSKAQADHDNKKVLLDLKPKITEFDGFIDYGTPILQMQNHIRVPVFSVRAFDEGFKLDIQDSYTMVLGGLISEGIQTIENKVPILGDIPFLGNLFRKKTERAIRKNLILFVTPRILQASGQPVNP